MTLKLKKIFFRIIEPIFPYGRDVLLFLRVIRHFGRQRYPIGYLDKNKTINDFKNHLYAVGFRKNKIAWEDEGEILGMRKLENFDWCYHVRLFADGEIRGHYERTVESNFWDHFFEIGMQQRSQEFLDFLSGMLEPNPELEKSIAIVSR